MTPMPFPFLTRRKPWMITLLRSHSSHDEHPMVKTAQATLFVTKDGCTQDVIRCAHATDSRVCTHQRARHGSVLCVVCCVLWVGGLTGGGSGS